MDSASCRISGEYEGELDEEGEGGGETGCPRRLDSRREKTWGMWLGVVRDSWRAGLMESMRDIA